MLTNLPPEGTIVRFTRAVRTAKALQTARLIRPLRKYETDQPADQFEVDFGGERWIVMRTDIEEA